MLPATMRGHAQAAACMHLQVTPKRQQLGEWAAKRGPQAGGHRRHSCRLLPSCLAMGVRPECLDLEGIIYRRGGSSREQSHAGDACLGW